MNIETGKEYIEKARGLLDKIDDITRLTSDLQITEMEKRQEIAETKGMDLFLKLLKITTRKHFTFPTNEGDTDYVFSELEFKHMLYLVRVLLKVEDLDKKVHETVVDLQKYRLEVQDQGFELSIYFACQLVFRRYIGSRQYHLQFDFNNRNAVRRDIIPFRTSTWEQNKEVSKDVFELQMECNNVEERRELVKKLNKAFIEKGITSELLYSSNWRIFSTDDNHIIIRTDYFGIDETELIHAYTIATQVVSDAKKNQ
ncbi:hypothetical protein ACQUY5_16595 [Bacillus cereus]|uniref:hypothetical protein n=1 Tax=Bacillus cereus TaxID=1396 RepID=UPI003D182B1F